MRYNLDGIPTLNIEVYHATKFEQQIYQPIKGACKATIMTNTGGLYTQNPAENRQLITQFFNHAGD